VLPGPSSPADPPPQIKDHKSDLARWETLDMGKPIDEAEWDMVGDGMGKGAAGRELQLHVKWAV
jgi:hypothetical protein